MPDDIQNSQVHAPKDPAFVNLMRGTKSGAGKGFDVAAMDPLGPDFVHTATERAKLAFADREKFYGDPKFVNVPMETLLSDAYNDARRTLVGETASLDLRPAIFRAMAVG